MAEYDAWAEFYDLLHPGLPGEAELYVGNAVRIGGPVLELGCGTGRLAIPMAMAGLDVTGLDISRPMLAECRRKAHAVGRLRGKLKLVHADMTDFDLDREFDFIAMAYRTFMHVIEPEQQRRCLAAVRRHLSEHGVFILNVWAPRPSVIAPHISAASGAMRLVGRRALPGVPGRNLLHFCAARYDEGRQVMVEDHLIQILDKKGAIRETRTLTLVRAWMYPREMDHLVRLCGFKVESVMGDFDGAPFAEPHTEMIWILRRAS